jgi:hypothetical protein
MCGYNLTRADALRVGRDFHNCPVCENKIITYDLPVKLLERDRVFADATVLPQRNWYHATLRADWHEDAAAAFVPVHIGSYNSALMRSRDLRDLDGWGHPEDTVWTIYELTLKPEATYMEHVFEDSDSVWPDNFEDFILATNGRSVVRYLNNYEDPGSISLLADASVLQVVSVKQIKAADIDIELQRTYLNAA